LTEGREYKEKPEEEIIETREEHHDIILPIDDFDELSNL
jgi:hypothetical protein